jgi:hypothetical protein
LIFWRAEPDYYTKFENKSDADSDKEIYSLLRKIIANWQAGFYKEERFKFDSIAEGYDVDYKDPNEKWVIPDEMKKPIRGSSVYGLDDIKTSFMKGLKVWWVRQKLTLKAKKKKRRR